MLSPEILKKIQEIKIRTRRVMNGTSAGGHIIKQKGSGFEFDQIRAYSYGDDIRFMDWNSSARTGKLLVRQYLDEKNRTIIICLDISSSTFFASHHAVTSDIMQHIAAIIAFVGEYEKDNIGLILFSDRIEKFIPPMQGYEHIMYIIEAIFSYPRQEKKTNLNVLLQYLVESFTKQAAIVVVSDFISPDFQQSLQNIAFRREVIAIRCLDLYVRQAPKSGYVWGQDLESGNVMLFDFYQKSGKTLQALFHERIHEQNNLFKRLQVDCFDVETQRDYLKSLILFFKRRMVVP
jgi:uncharacterized protein (DUF58 family)